MIYSHWTRKWICQDNSCRGFLVLQSLVMIPTTNFGFSSTNSASSEGIANLSFDNCLFAWERWWRTLRDFFWLFTSLIQLEEGIGRVRRDSSALYIEVSHTTNSGFEFEEKRVWRCLKRLRGSIYVFLFTNNYTKFEFLSYVEANHALKHGTSVSEINKWSCGKLKCLLKYLKTLQNTSDFWKLHRGLQACLLPSSWGGVWKTLK